MLPLGAALVPEDGGERIRQTVLHGSQGIEPCPQRDPIGGDQSLSHLGTDLVPARVLGIVEGQAARRREKAWVARLGGVEDGPEPWRQAGLVRLQGVT